MSTEIVKIESQAIVQPSYGADTGLDDIRLRPTNVEIVQRTSRFEGASKHIGELHDVLTGAFYEELTVVPLKIFKGRVLFPPGGDLGAEPICRSSDGVRPSQYAKFPKAALCKTCPQSQWVNGQKPPCAEKWRMLYIVKETGLPRFQTFGGMALKPLKLLLEQIKQDIEMLRYKGQSVTLFDYYFTIKTQEVTGAKGTYNIPKFVDVKRTPNTNEFGPLFEEYVLRSKAQDLEEVTEQVKEDATKEAIEGEYVPQA